MYFANRISVEDIKAFIEETFCVTVKAIKISKQATSCCHCSVIIKGKFKTINFTYSDIKFTFPPNMAKINITRQEINRMWQKNLHKMFGYTYEVVLNDSLDRELDATTIIYKHKILYDLH